LFADDAVGGNSHWMRDLTAPHGAVKLATGFITMGLARLAVAAVAPLLITACTTSPTTPIPEPEPIPQIVAQPLEIWTSDGRLLGSTTITATAGQSVTITAQDLIDRGVPMDTVDHIQFALRERNEGGVLGKLVTSTPTSLTFVPTTSPRILWGMTTVNGADYGAAGVYLAGSNVFRRYLTVNRLTAANNTYPDLVPLAGSTVDFEAGLAMLNEIWTVAGVQLAHMTWTGDAATADFHGGLATLSTMTVAGFHGERYFSANPKFGSIVTRNVIVAEAIESLHTFNDLLHLPTTQALFGQYNAAEMTPVGKDYVRFAALLARDNRDVF